MQQYEIDGTLIEIMDAMTFPSGFVKREFVLRTDEMYPQEVKFELVKVQILKIHFRTQMHRYIYIYTCIGIYMFTYTCLSIGQDCAHRQLPGQRAGQGLFQHSGQPMARKVLHQFTGVRV